MIWIFGSKKGIPVHSANRLQRWATVLLGYDFKIQYQRTENFGQADALSRLISSHQQPDEETVIAAISVEDDIRHQLSGAIHGIPVTADDIRRATDNDPMLQQVISFVNTQWPKRVDGDLKQLHQRRASLAVVNRCLMFADRVIIPPPLRNRILKQFHSGHPGISRIKSIARSYVYRPSMDTDIEKLVKSCLNCQQASKNPPKQESVPWPQTNSPWTRLHIDFAGPINGATYLIVIDSHSKWPEVVSLTSATTTATIAALRRIFSQHGLPKIVVSDNGTQFSSAQFNDF